MTEPDLCKHELDPRTCSLCKGGGERPFETAECRSCSELIIWTKTAKGENMPVDAEPVDGDYGNIALSRTSGTVVYSRVVGRGRGRYVSHSTTCAEAHRWRRKKS